MVWVTLHAAAADREDRDITTLHNRRSGMAKIVEADFRQLGLLQDILELPQQITQIKWGIDSVWKDLIMGHFNK
jgi:hypothetical protein